MSAIKLRIKIILKAIFHAFFGNTRLKARILRFFSRDYELDSKELENLFCKALNTQANKGNFIASLTTFPARIDILKYTLHSIFSQSLQAKRVILVLSIDEFLNPTFGAFSPQSTQKTNSSIVDEKLGLCNYEQGNRANGSLTKQTTNIPDLSPQDEFALDSNIATQLESMLPSEILAFKKYGLEIMWVEKNLYQYNKIIPILRTFPNETIITIDDDIYYNSNTFATLYQSHLQNKGVIFAHKARIVPFSECKIANFFEWKIIRKNNKQWQKIPRFDIFLEGCGGVLYPPNCLYKDVCDSKIFLALAPKADDIWLWAMALLQGTKIACVENPLMGNGAAFTNKASNKALWQYNMNGGNDKQMRKMLEHYPQILQILNKKRDF